MVGQTILHYRILEELGRGGMGVVYKALDTDLDRTVAIKFLPHHIAVNSEDISRFRIEARAAAALNHPNITTIYSIEKSEESGSNTEVFLVMEYIDGVELKDKIKNEKISIDEAVGITVKICEGLEAAHKRGIVHRDIKSSNIMVTDDGTVKIMDFGLAKLGNGENLTRLGTTLGTVSYMSPEQTTGENVDQQTDLWSFGVVMYELFTGHLPFKGDYDQAIVYSIMNENPRELNSYDENIPQPVQFIIFKALAKNKEERYQSATDLLNDLRLLKQSTESQQSISAQYSFIDQNVKIKKTQLLKSRYFKLIVILISLSVIVFLLFNYISQVNQNSQGELSLVPAEKHIAVLPFNVIGGSANDQSLAEGLGEIITSKLSQLEQYRDKLWIVPTSEIQKAKVKNPADAFKNFGINLAITGSIQKLKNKWQLIINLINPSEKRQISSRVIDEPLNGISSIQDEAVFKTAEMLDLRVEDNIQNSLKTGETDNPVANDLYLQARGNLLHFENIKNLNAAIELFKKAINEDTAYALAYAGLGEAYLRRYQKTEDVSWFNKAKESCNRAIDINENFARVHVTLGMLYMETGKYEDANKEFLKAEDIDPSDVDAYQGQATAYNKQGKLDEAESIYKKVIKMRPDYWAGYTHLGIFYYLQGRYKEAAGQFEKVIKLTPQNASAYRNLGAMYYYMDQKADAIVMFKRSIEIEPDYSVYSNLGTLYYYEGLYSDAVSMYEKALKMQDTDYIVWGYLASAYSHSSADSSKIIFAVRKAKKLAENHLKINPVDPLTLINVASYCAELNLPDSALTITKKVESLNPKDVNVMILIGVVYEQLGKRNQAMVWVRKSIENGYPVEELNHIPELKSLRSDERYKKLVATIK
jgi:serine/threonine protein kinase/Tfp pilus assembly protein PilF